MKRRNLTARRLDTVSFLLMGYFALFAWFSILPPLWAALLALCTIAAIAYTLHLGKKRFEAPIQKKRSADAAKAHWARELALVEPEECLRRLARALDRKHQFEAIVFLPECVVGRIGERRVLVACPQRLDTLDVHGALFYLTLARRHRADLILACPGGFQEAVSETLRPFPSAFALLDGDRLKRLAPDDYTPPATLSKNKSPVFQDMLNKKRSKTYLGYAFGLTLLYLVLNTVWLIPPAIALITLAILSYFKPEIPEALFA